MNSFAVRPLSFSLVSFLALTASSFGQAVASPGMSTQAGANVQSSPPLKNHSFDPGELAFNRGPSTLPTPIPQLDIHRACAPSPVLVGWKPLHWPKYDSYRDVIFLTKPLQTGYQLDTLAQDGTVAPYPTAVSYEPGGVAPVGDGRVYFLAAGVLTYVDANDVLRPVVNQAGPLPWVVTDMVYHSSSNSLFVLSSSDGTAGACTPPGFANAVVTRIPLNGSGDVVFGPLAVVTFCAGAANTSVGRIVRHADGRLLFRVASSGAMNGDVLWLDTATMALNWFCTQQNAPGEALSNELAYSAKLGGVVTSSTAPCFFCLPTDRLRVFAAGSTGTGQTVCAWQNESRNSYWELAP